MLKKIFSVALICFFIQQASAKDFPDFTELVEKQGAAVVNISTTQIIRETQVMPGSMNPNLWAPALSSVRTATS
jgi:serine protease Do